jgi:hypothetical protein
MKQQSIASQAYSEVLTQIMKAFSGTVTSHLHLWHMISQQVAFLPKFPHMHCSSWA